MIRVLRVIPGALLAVVAAAAEPAAAARVGADDRPWAVAGQVTAVGLALPRFASPYADPSISFGPGPEASWSTVATLFAGTRLWPGASVVVDGEWADGAGLPNVSGVSGYPDANIIRVAKVGTAPYVARAFVQQELDLERGPPPSIEPPATPEDRFSPDGDFALRRPRPRSRLTFTAGKVAVSDFFDAASASGDPRHRFMNWAIMTNGAWDYAADTRGYTWAAVGVLSLPAWALRAGVAMMPTEPNGPVLDGDLGEARAVMLEGQVRWTTNGRAGSARLLGYENRSRAGRYADALAAAPAGAPPDLAAVRRPGAAKRGAALLVEQEAGPAQVFLRASWNDGRTETFAFTEIDRAASAGVELPVPGPAGRPAVVGAAVAVGALSPDHARYLAAGGRGFQLGDGRLRNAPETIAEAFFLVRALAALELTADAQVIWNPGMNADRGPAAVLGLRLHAHM